MTFNKQSNARRAAVESKPTLTQSRIADLCKPAQNNGRRVNAATSEYIPDRARSWRVCSWRCWSAGRGSCSWRTARTRCPRTTYFRSWELGCRWPPARRRYHLSLNRRSVISTTKNRSKQVSQVNLYTRMTRLDGRVVRALDLRSIGHGFDYRPPRFRVQPWSSCSHAHTCLYYQAV